jgi:hypothetical protein
MGQTKQIAIYTISGRSDTADIIKRIGKYLAIHKTHLRSDVFTLTHIPSGLSVSRLFKTVGDAERFARMMVKNIPERTLAKGSPDMKSKAIANHIKRVLGKRAFAWFKDNAWVGEPFEFKRGKLLLPGESEVRE